MTNNTQTALADLCSIVSKYSSYHYSTKRSLLQFESPKEILSLEASPVLDAFVHTLLLSRISTRERLTKEDEKDLLSMAFLVASSQSQEPEQLNKICRAFEEGSRLRRLFVTEEGYIGSGPREMEEGDMICVLFGCSVPVILRRLEDDEFYQFVGECYLHGFMDAEAVALQIKGVLHEQEFTLV